MGSVVITLGCFRSQYCMYRGPVSYDEDGGSRQGGYNNNRRGGYGGRGGGRGRGSYEQRPKRVLSPEAAAVNEALAAATSWRQLNTVLEQQVCGQILCCALQLLWWRGAWLLAQATVTALCMVQAQG